MGAGCDPGALHSHIHDPWPAGSHRGSERQGEQGEIIEGNHHLSAWGSGSAETLGAGATVTA